MTFKLSKIPSITLKGTYNICFPKKWYGTIPYDNTPSLGSNTDYIMS